MIVVESRVLRNICRVLNAALIALCCFFVARIAYTARDALRTPVPEPGGATAAPPAPPQQRAWSDREVILSRNLFNAALLAPAEPSSPPQEEIRETELPLGLLGTIASSRTEVAWAAVWDEETKKSLVLRPGDEVRDGQAVVLRIERERVLLSENGATRELVIQEDGRYRPPRRPPPQPKARTDKRRRRSRGGR